MILKVGQGPPYLDPIHGFCRVGFSPPSEALSGDTKKTGAEAPAVGPLILHYHWGWTTVPSPVLLSTTDEKTMNVPPEVSVQTSI